MRNNLFTISFAVLLSLPAFGQPRDRLSPDVAVSIYPNPAVDYLVIELSDSFGDVQFELNSMLGNNIAIESEGVGDGTFRISLKGFATGYYFLIVKDGDSEFKKAYRFLKN